MQTLHWCPTKHGPHFSHSILILSVIFSQGFHTAATVQRQHSTHPHFPQVSSGISACLADILSWMAVYQQKLNLSKSKLVHNPEAVSPSQDRVISLDNSWLSVILGCSKQSSVHLGNQPFFSPHTTKLQKNSQFPYCFYGVLLCTMLSLNFYHCSPGPTFSPGLKELLVPEILEVDLMKLPV